MLVGRLEVFGHLRLEVVIAVVAMHAARLFRMGMDVDRHDVVDVGRLQLGHFRFPARQVSDGLADCTALKIDYTI
jgi:hypothetical protein